MEKYLQLKSDSTAHIDMCDELPFWSAAFGLKLLEYVVYKPGITALDIGFGTGFPLTELAMRLGDSCNVYGIDPATEVLARVEKKIAAFGITGIRLITGVAESIPLPDSSIDLITSNNGINNVNDVDKVFSECSRIMKPGGQFVWTMNTDKTMFELYTQLECVLSEMHLGKEIDAMHRHIAQKRPPIDYLLSLLRKYGFIIRDLEQDQFFYKFTDGTAMLNHHFIRLAFMEAWKKLLPEARVEEVFGEVEARLNDFAKAAGGMKLSVPFVLVNAIMG